MSQAFFRERTQEELPFQDRVSGVVIAFKEIRLMNWMRKAYSSAVIVSGMDQDKPWMMSATRSESEKCKWGNLEAIGSWSIQLSNHDWIKSPFPRIQKLPRWRWRARDLILLQMQEPTLGFPGCQMEDVLKYLSRNQRAQRVWRSCRPT